MVGVYTEQSPMGIKYNGGYRNIAEVHTATPATAGTDVAAGSL